MPKISRPDPSCPVARSLQRVGEGWSIMILREAFYGSTRFDQFQKNLDIATNMLSRRLTLLVDEGLLERRQYCEKPPRYEYVLTPVGRDFRPVMLALMDWGNKHFSDGGIGAELVDRNTGKTVDLMLVDRNTGKPVTSSEHRMRAGPAASEFMRERLDRLFDQPGGAASSALPAASFASNPASSS